MAESAKEKKDKLPGSNLLSKLLIRKINKSKGNKDSKKLMKDNDKLLKKSDKAIKKHLKNKKKEAKKAAFEAAPGTSRLEKRLNVAGAKARVKKAERQEKRGNRKEEKAEKKSLRKSNRAVKKATIASMPGTSKLEKRLNFAGAKARARKADRQESKKLKKEGPLQQTSRKIEMPSQEVKNPLLKGIKVLKTKPSPKDRLEVEKAKPSNKGKSETRISFEKEFAKARAEKGPNSSFTFRGKEYVTRLKGEAKYGAKVKAVKKAKSGGKITDPEKFKLISMKNKETGKIEYFKSYGGESTNGGKTYTPNVRIKISKDEYDSMMGPGKARQVTKVKSKTKKVKAIKKGAKAQDGGKLTGPKKKNGKDKMKDLNLSDLVHRPSKNKDENWIMLASNPPKYRNMKTKEVISEAEYYKRTGKKKPEGGIKPMRK